MTRTQAVVVIALLIHIALWTYAQFLFVGIPTVEHHDTQNEVKIECFLHRDNPDVHKLCVDHGYDR